MSENSRELTELIRDLAKDHEDPAAGELPAVWHQIQELGLVTIGLPEEAGGSGGETGDLLVVIRELGRAGIGTPVVEASTAAFAIGPPRSGAFDTVVMAGAGDPSAAAAAELGMVAFGGLADRVVVIGESAVVPAALEPAGSDIEVTTDLAGLPAAWIRVKPAQYGLAAPVEPDLVAERLMLARTAAIVGAACGAYELTRDYVTHREQFGAPLIKFPAVATALARMAVAIGNAEAGLDRALAVCDASERPRLRRFGAAAAARVAAASMATLVASTAHQLHGAVGVTAEYGLHRYTRKLWAWRDADLAERAVSARLGARTRTVDEALLWDELLA